MKTPKITESQILEGIKAGLNDSQIAKMYGMTQGGISPRCKKLRASLTAQEEPDPEPTAPPLATVPWESLRKDMRLLWGKKRFIVRSLDGGTCVLTSMGGQAIPLTRKEFERRGFSPVPEGDPQGAPVIEYKLGEEPEGQPKYEPKSETVMVKKPEPVISKETCVVDEMASHRTRPEMAIIKANPKLLRESESSGQKITEIKMPVLTQAEAKEVLKQYDEANLGKEQADPFESLIMAKAREDVTRFKQIRSEIQKRLDTADHIPIEILNDYEKLIQAAGR